MATHRDEVPAALLFEAMLHIVHDAMVFVRAGLQHGKAGEPASSIQVLELALHKKLSVAALGSGLYDAEPRPRRSKEGWRLALTKALTDFHDRCRSAGRLHFDGLTLPLLGVALADGAEEELLCAGDPKGLVVPPDGSLRRTKPVQHAYEMSRFNRLQAEQRVVLLLALGDMLIHRYADEAGAGAAQAELSAASDSLWAAHGVHEMNQFSLALILGGDAQRECVERVRQKFGPGMSVMHLHERGGVMPSFVSKQDVESMRRELAKAQPQACTEPLPSIGAAALAPEVKKAVAKVRQAAQAPKRKVPPFVSPSGFDF